MAWIIFLGSSFLLFKDSDFPQLQNTISLSDSSKTTFEWTINSIAGEDGNTVEGVGLISVSG